MNTNNETTEPVAAKSAPLAIESALRTAKFYETIAAWLCRPEFRGWDMLGGGDRIIRQHLIQLFPPDHLNDCAVPSALAIARATPGEWTKDEKSYSSVAWECECSGELAGLRLVLHRVEAKQITTLKPANLIDIEATAKAYAA